jgi:hypothetical protein
VRDSPGKTPGSMLSYQCGGGLLECGVGKEPLSGVVDLSNRFTAQPSGFYDRRGMV